MKKIILTSFIVSISAFVFAQKVVVSGIVNDDQGKPVAFAFVKDAEKNYATFTDTYGAFTFKVDAADRLIVGAMGYKTAVVKIADPQSVNVALSGAGGTSIKNIDPDAFKERISTEGMTKNAATGYIAKENSLHGTRYFFDTWVHGFVITNEDSIKQNNNYLFNYGKMDGSVLFSDDGTKMREIDRGLVKSFTLFDGAGQTYVFEKVSAIDPSHFVQVLSSGSNYKIYKQLNTKFIPNNYVSNGMTSNGNNYDEIKDEPVYYAVKVPGGAPIKFTLRSKSIKTAFAADVAKVSKYLSDHDADVDDRYLRGLGDYLNN